MTEASHITTYALMALGESARERLFELQTSLESILGDNLLCLLVHGSAIRGGYRDGHSDIDIVVVLNDSSRQQLESIANALQLARYSARIEAMILTADEIPRAADVFPLLYDDIRGCHLVLSGEDPFSKLHISNQHRRLRIEQELREAQIRLRRAVVDGSGSSDVLANVVLRKVKQIRGPLHALLTLQNIHCNDTLDTVLQEAGKHYDLNTAPLIAVRDSPDLAYQTLTALLDKAIEEVDAMPESEEAT